MRLFTFFLFSSLFNELQAQTAENVVRQIEEETGDRCFVFKSEWGRKIIEDPWRINYNDWVKKTQKLELI